MNRRNARILATLLSVLITLPSCGGSPNHEQTHSVVGGLPRASLQLGEDAALVLAVEIADTPAAQQRGLMNIERIPDGYGMVFMWSDTGRRPFHMKNTLIPLDIAWWNSDMEIVDIQTMVPCESDPCPTYHPAADHVAAVEVNAGLLDSSGIEVGDQVTLVGSWPTGL